MPHCRVDPSTAVFNVAPSDEFLANSLTHLLICQSRREKHIKSRCRLIRVRTKNWFFVVPTWDRMSSISAEFARHSLIHNLLPLRLRLECLIGLDCGRSAIGGLLGNSFHPTMLVYQPHVSTVVPTLYAMRRKLSIFLSTWIELAGALFGWYNGGHLTQHNERQCLSGFD